MRQKVVELHGGLDRVRCLSCGERTARQALNQRLRAANAHWDAIAGTLNPDGDADLARRRRALEVGMDSRHED